MREIVEQDVEGPDADLQDVGGQDTGDQDVEGRPPGLVRRGFVRHPILFGMVGGFVWGAILRGWMRLIATDPAFSWSGTGFILGASTIVGTVLGIAWWRRERRGRGWWRFLGLSTVLVGSGAGIVMVPSFFLGAMAFGRTTWRPWVRVVLAIAAVALQVGFFVGEPLPDGRALLGYPVYAVMLTLEAYAISVVFRPSLEGAPPARWVQRAALLSIGIGVAAIAVLVVGLRP